jgi:soluble lytic murein transglycosylase-like protein
MQKSYFIMGSCLVLLAVPGNQANTLAVAALATSDDGVVRGPQYRYQHARELLGESSGIRREIASSCEEDTRCSGDSANVATARLLTNFIYNQTLALLPTDYKQQAPRIAQALIDTANKHQMDPLFLMAVIAHESHFNPNALGAHGEIGLMQIKPSTARWLSHEIAKGAIDATDAAALLRDPVENIKLGANYFALLRTSFKHQSSLYISAYNMGAANLRNMLKSGAQPRIYSDKVMAGYIRLNEAFESLYRISQQLTPVTVPQIQLADASTLAL